MIFGPNQDCALDLICPPKCPRPESLAQAKKKNSPKIPEKCPDMGISFVVLGVSSWGFRVSGRGYLFSIFVGSLGLAISCLCSRLGLSEGLPPMELAFDVSFLAVS